MSKDNRDFFKEKKDWSEIKDTLLGAYLKPYFQKVLMTKRPIFMWIAFLEKVDLMMENQVLRLLHLIYARIVLRRQDQKMLRLICVLLI